MTGISLNRKQVWLLAIRPKTLPAAAAPVIVGTSIAYVDGSIRIGLAMACLATALLLQIGSNLANDVFDYEKGVDQSDRTGPTRVTQSGILTPGEVKRGMMIVFGLSSLFGLLLIFAGGWPILILGVAAIISAVAYTGGPYPFGYHGFGDFFVFVFFGLAAVAGTYYIQASRITATVWWMAISMGLLTVAILVVNNLRDVGGDRKTNKRTLVVRFGEHFGRLEYVICILGAYIVPLGLWGVGNLPLLSLLVLVTIPFAMRLVREVFNVSGRAFNKTLADSGRLELTYAFCFTLGMIVNSLLA